MGAVPALLVAVIFVPVVYVPAVQPTGCDYSCISGGHSSMMVSVTQELAGLGACLVGLSYYFPC